jgi:hypothetical protein
MTSNKRGSRRFSVEGLEGRMAMATQVEIVNISLGGISIKVDRRLTVGSLCTLKLQQGKELLAIRGIVVWSALTGFRKAGVDSFPEYSVGLRFTDVLSEQGKSLAKLLDQNKAFKEQRLSGLRIEIKAKGRALIDQPQTFQVKLLGVNGMLIENSKELEIAKTYPMEIVLDGTPIRFKGKVSSQFEVSPRLHEIGIEFDEISAGDKALLKSMLQSSSRAKK